MNAQLQQRSDEWYEARIGRVTGSRIAAVLGHSPWQTRAQLLKEMVAEAMGERVHKDSPAMAWGRTHEQDALDDFALSCLDMDADLTEGGWFTLGEDLGYSPDAYTPALLVEVKAPYSRLLPDDVPDHYADQVQLGMHVMDKPEAALHFWTPGESRTFFIGRDPAWLEAALPAVADFMAAYRAALLDPSAWAVQERDDRPWRGWAELYRQRLARLKEAEADVEAAKKELEALAGGKAAQGFGVKLEVVERQGAVDWKRLSKALSITQETQDEYRSKATTYTRVTLTEGK